MKGRATLWSVQNILSNQTVFLSSSFAEEPQWVPEGAGRSKKEVRLSLQRACDLLRYIQHKEEAGYLATHALWRRMKISLRHWNIHRSSRKDWELGWRERDGIASLAMQRGSEPLKNEFGSLGLGGLFFWGKDFEEPGAVCWEGSIEVRSWRASDKHRRAFAWAKMWMQVLFFLNFIYFDRQKERECKQGEHQR